MPLHNQPDMRHTTAMTMADAATGDLRATRDDAWYAHAEANKAYDEAHAAAYDRAYESLL
jgi:hypothetical protein